MQSKKAVVMLSGGLDSTTVLAMAREKGFECHTMSFNYAQRHSSELKASKQFSSLLGAASHREVMLDAALFGGSALTDMSIDVPDFDLDPKAIAVTYVPGRNTIFLSMALAYGESIGANDIFIGANIYDYSNYPDCRPEYLEAFEQMANLATKAAIEGAKVSIHAPLVHLTKAEIIKEGLRLGVDYSQTVSCYQANEAGEACGVCDSCMFRKKGFSEAGVEDPTKYAA